MTARPVILTVSTFVLLVGIFVLGGLYVRHVVKKTFANEFAVRSARVLVYSLLSDQLNQETGLRGYAATHDPDFLSPYQEGLGKFDRDAGLLKRFLGQLDLKASLVSLEDAVATNGEWKRKIAPLMDPSRTGSQTALQKSGKTLVDHFRGDMDRIDKAVVARRDAVVKESNDSIERISIFTVFAGLLIAVIGSVVGSQQLRLLTRLEREARATAEMQAAYQTEKRISDTLQSAFLLKPLPKPAGITLSATYAPAADEARVGGDWYDGIEMNDGQLMLTIGDAAGHGIDAAVAMNRARQSLITSALHSRDPGTMLARANTELMAEGQRMVTAICGQIDAADYSFSYASAGHPPPILLEPGRAPRTLSFGGLPLGVMNGAAYQTFTVQTMPGAMIVFYTDGALEHSRDVVTGERLLLDAIVRANEAGLGAEAIHETIFKNVRSTDDVAIVTLSFRTPAKDGALDEGRTMIAETNVVRITPGAKSLPASRSLRRAA